MKPTCPNCGAEFSKLKDGKIPTHDIAPPLRAVCRGSGHEPKAKADTPLWKDDPTQEARDFVARARTEMLVYGFGIVKYVAGVLNQKSGEMECPLCQGKVKFFIAASNGHCAAKCATPKCINIRE